VSALSQIFAVLDTRLQAVTGLQEYERMPTGDPAAFPALHLFDGGDEPTEQESDATRLTLAITVEGYVEGFAGAAAHDAMTDLHAKAVAALCFDASSNLGGLVENIEISGQRRVDTPQLGEVRRLAFAQDFTIIFATARGDPATLL
jgi:hypothetical protein